MNKKLLSYLHSFFGPLLVLAIFGACAPKDQGDEFGSISNCVEGDYETQYRYRPLCKELVKRGEYSAWMQYNSLGLRDREYPTKRKGVLRVLFLGNSKLTAPGLPEENSFVRLMEGRLKSEGLRVEIVNGGVEGVHPGHVLLLAKRLEREYDPDLVVYWTDISSSALKTRLLRSFAVRGAGGGVERYSVELSRALHDLIGIDAVIPIVNKNYLFFYSLYLGWKRAQVSWGCLPKYFQKAKLTECLFGDSLDAIYQISEFFSARGKRFYLFADGEEMTNDIYFSPGTPLWIKRVMGWLSISYSLDYSTFAVQLASRRVPTKMFRSNRTWGAEYRVGPRDEHLNLRGHERFAEENIEMVRDVLGEKMRARSP